MSEPQPTIKSDRIVNIDKLQTEKTDKILSEIDIKKLDCTVNGRRDFTKMKKKLLDIENNYKMNYIELRTTRSRGNMKNTVIHIITDDKNTFSLEFTLRFTNHGNTHIDRQTKDKNLHSVDKLFRLLSFENENKEVVYVDESDQELKSKLLVNKI